MGLLRTDWDSTVHSLVDHLSKELGLLSTARVEVMLQQVTLVDQCSRYKFSSQADTPPNAFATMVVLLLQPWAVCVRCNCRLQVDREYQAK